MEFTAVLMAGGRGSRLTDLTSNTPKPLLPVANVPMIWYPIKMLERAGFLEVMIVTLDSWKKLVHKALVDICPASIKLQFECIPDDKDWGTADALRHIKSKIHTDVLIVGCDLVSDLSLHLVTDLHRTYDSTVTMLLAPSLDTADVTVPGGKVNKKLERDLIGMDTCSSRLLFLSSEADFEETVSLRGSLFKQFPHISVKSRLTDAHLYLIKRWALDILDTEKSISAVKSELIPYLVRKQFSKAKESHRTDLPKSSQSVISDLGTNTDLLNLSSEDGMMKMALDLSSWNDHHGDMDDSYHNNMIRCYAFTLSGGFCLRANSLVTYCEANRQVPRQLSQLAPDQEQQRLHPTVTLNNSQVGNDCQVGEGSTLAQKVNVKRSIIGKHCIIGEKVRISNSIIMDHVTIKDGCAVSGCIVCGDSHIGESCELKDCVIGYKQTIIPMSKLTYEILGDHRQRMMEV